MTGAEEGTRHRTLTAANLAAREQTFSPFKASICGAFTLWGINFHLIRLPTADLTPAGEARGEVENPSINSRHVSIRV